MNDGREERMMSKADKVKLRAIKPSEVNLLLRLWAEADLPFRPRGRDSLMNLRMQRLKDPELFVGAFIGATLVGAVIASDDGRKGWINRLAISPAARGKGIATMLVRYCEKILRKRGRLLFCVHIEGYNVESMKVFEHLGYRKEEDILYFTKREDSEY
jgi:ribosomal protein S18 acetylase RimI-like enzyme